MGSFYVGGFAIGQKIAELENEINSMAGAQSAVGRLETYTGKTPPANTIKANGGGSGLSRDEYPELWEFAQSSGNIKTQASKELAGYGDGDGVSTFTIPDLRGLFVRALDDLAGIDEGREIGTFQDHALEEHGHETANAYMLDEEPNSLDFIQDNTKDSSKVYDPIGAVKGANVDTETRPKNAALLYCIRYK